MRRTNITFLASLLVPLVGAMASEEDGLAWTSAVIQCATTSQAGEVSCEIKTGDKGWEKFSIHAFGVTNTLTTADLAKLDGFPLSSLQTSHEVGYEKLGGYTVHFRFDRAFYNPEKQLITEVIYVSVTKQGVTVSAQKTKEH